MNRNFETNVTKYDNTYYKRLGYYPKIHFIRFIMQYLKKDNITWLDIGCAKGYLVQELLENGINAYGIDNSEYAIKNALSLVRKKIQKGSVSKIPFEYEKFDVVSLFDVIEHIHPKDTEKAINEIHRVLKPNGVLILTTVNPCYIGPWITDFTHINVRPQKYWKIVLEKKFKTKINYLPAFLKYYPYIKFNLLRIIPDEFCFMLEEPLRWVVAYFFGSLKGRTYIFAKMR